MTNSTTTEVTTSRNEIITGTTSSNNEDVHVVEHQSRDMENEEMNFSTSNDFHDDIEADVVVSNPPEIELPTVPRSRLQRKAVSFSLLPAVTDPPNTSVTSEDFNVTTTTTLRRRPPPLTRSSKSLPRLDLSSGKVYYDDEDHNSESRNTNDGNSKSNKSVIRDQYIQKITNIVPAGKNSSNVATTSPSMQWAKIRQSVLKTTTINETSDMNQSSDARVTYNMNDTPSRTAPPATTTSTTTNQTHHYRIRSRHGHDPSFWILQTEIMANLISRYVTWTYRASFYVTILSSYIAFMGIMMLFALGIYVSAMMEPDCVFVGNSNEFSGFFMDAVHLSWTTLSTTGYGIVGPEIRGTNRRCVVVNMLMAFESFLGVLFVGFATAVIIGKIVRSQSVAQILCSDKICIKFGTAAALDPEFEDDDNMDPAHAASISDRPNDETTPQNERPKHPFPVLEFRMMNVLSGERGGEILNAQVSVVASVLYNVNESQRHIESLQVRNSYHLNPSDLVSLATETTSHAAKVVGAVGTMAAMSTVKMTGVALSCAKKLTTGSAFQQLVHPGQWAHRKVDATSTDDLEPLRRELDLMTSEPKHDTQKHIIVDEGNATLAPPRMYHRLQVETDRHPYFRRVWYIRHVLDESSPLLSDEARHLIRSNNGEWPSGHSNATSIRDHLRFNDIIIGFSGTANVSGRKVFAQKVYSFSDTCIGYSFANMISLENNHIVVHQNMLNEITEQFGGGAEKRPTSDPNDGSALFRAAKGGVSRNVGADVKAVVPP